MSYNLYMRQYIRHPSDIPIDFHISETDRADVSRLVDISLGGLCFRADKPFNSGTKLHINIPINFLGENASPEESSTNCFDGEGTVAWCLKDDEGFAVGVQFEDSMTQFGVRMVEQICHIEHYKKEVLQSQGRQLSSEEAAREWVERFAAEFPSVS